MTSVFCVARPPPRPPLSFPNWHATPPWSELLPQLHLTFLNSPHFTPSFDIWWYVLFDKIFPVLSWSVMFCPNHSKSEHFWAFPKFSKQVKADLGLSWIIMDYLGGSKWFWANHTAVLPISRHGWSSLRCMMLLGHARAWLKSGQTMSNIFEYLSNQLYRNISNDIKIWHILTRRKLILSHRVSSSHEPRFLLMSAS